MKTLSHIAMIMDGNRRWATAKHLPKIMGHTEGAKTLKRIATAVKQKGIPYMTVYALSTENLRRSPEELAHLFSLFGKLIGQFDDLTKEDVRIQVIGDLSLLPDELHQSLREIETKTASHTSLTLVLAIAYGGRNEIVRAVNQAIQQGNPVDETSFGSLLDSGNMPDVDLIIRTGGHQRLSNFLLWKGSYAELYFTDTYWPAFDAAALDTALAWFEEQKRNKGK